MHSDYNTTVQKQNLIILKQLNATNFGNFKRNSKVF